MPPRSFPEKNSVVTYLSYLSHNSPSCLSRWTNVFRLTRLVPSRTRYSGRAVGEGPMHRLSTCCRLPPFSTDGAPLKNKNTILISKHQCNVFRLSKQNKITKICVYTFVRSLKYYCNSSNIVSGQADRLNS